MPIPIIPITILDISEQIYRYRYLSIIPKLPISVQPYLLLYLLLVDLVQDLMVELVVDQVSCG